jgi:putative acetyltransferase
VAIPAPRRAGSSASVADAGSPDDAVTLKDGRSVDLRPGTPDDGAALMAVHRAAILGLGGEAYTKAELESWAAGLKPEGYAAAMAGGETFLLAWARDGALAAFASYEADRVVGFYVHPDWARCGLGTLLLARAEAAIIAAGHRTILIESSMSGLPFYRARGYREVARRSADSRGGVLIQVADLEKSV